MNKEVILLSSDPIGGPIACLCVLLLAHAYLANAEAALTTLHEDAPKPDEEDVARYGEKLSQMIEEPKKYLLTLRICRSLCVFFSGGIAAYVFLPMISNTLLSGNWNNLYSKLAVLLGIELLLMVCFQIFGFSLPQIRGEKYSEKTAKRTAPMVRFLAGFMWPTVWFVDIVVRFLSGLTGSEVSDVDEVTEDDILQMVDMGGETGAIEENEKEMIENIFEFNNQTAEDIMVHRTDVTSIWVNDDKDTVIKTILDTGLSRFPVYDQDIDDIIGILSTRDYLLNTHRKEPKPIRGLLRDAYFVPEHVAADVLFRNMQKKKVHMAIVVDEYGGMSGIVTMEDLLEQIVGNIYDEFDPQAENEIVQIGENLWRISGAASLDEISEIIGVELPEDEDYDTLGGLIFNQLTTIPKDGSHPEMDVYGLHILVERLEDHRVDTAIVSKIERESDVSEHGEENDTSES